MTTGVLDSGNPFEADVARALGMSRGTAKNFRNEKMVGGTDFRVEGGRVVYLPPGLKKIKKAAAAPKKTGAETAADAAEDLTVKRLVINRHILIATKKNGRDEVRVKVRDSAVFVPGMVLAACVPEGVGLYRFTGRAPRRKGHW